MLPRDVGRLSGLDIPSSAYPISTSCTNFAGGISFSSALAPSPLTEQRVTDCDKSRLPAAGWVAVISGLSGNFRATGGSELTRRVLKRRSLCDRASACEFELLEQSSDSERDESERTDPCRFLYRA